MFAFSSCSSPEPGGVPPLSVSAFLQQDSAAGFSKALEPAPLEFPRDHGAHPSYRNEWWYITGNLEDPGGRRFGFQFTLFRNALGPRKVDHSSRWATNQVYLAHVAITDANADRFYSDERFSREALGLAGVRHGPFGAWLEDWTLEGGSDPDCGECFLVHLRAESRDFGVDLSLRSDGPPVLHGDQGLSHKSDTPGNASYYYSYTRLQTTGELRLGEQRHTVIGDSWLDHEWSTSALEKDQAGWDWFSIQLSDDTELMLFQLRNRHDPGRHYRYGTYVSSRGDARQLSGAEFSIEATDTWSSSETGVTYPSGWLIRLPGMGLDLTLTPLVNAQEQNHSFRYWEGAVDIDGSRAEQTLSGRGYAELTGYH